MRTRSSRVPPEPHGAHVECGVRDPEGRGRGRSVVTNTTPTTSIRGAGRPEAAQAIERAIDLFAAEVGLDPAEVRRTNFIAKDAFPYTTATGATYDSGDYEGALDLLLRSAGYEELREEQRRRRERGRRRGDGLGLAAYVEITNPVGEAEFGEVEITEDGGAILRTGSHSHGQGHETTFAMIAAERLGLPVERVEVHRGDTDDVRRGPARSGRSRPRSAASPDGSRPTRSSRAADGLAADYLEASAADVVLDVEPGSFHVADTATRALVGRPRVERVDGRPARRAEGAHEFQAPPASPSACTSPSSRWTRRPGRSSSSATSRWTTRAR